MRQQPYIHGKYKTQEEKDIEGFLEFIKWYEYNYSVTAATAYGSEIDVASANVTGGTVLTEIKCRDKKYLGKSVMIEPEKLDSLEKYWKKKQMWTFYLNLYEGTDIAYLFFMSGILHLRDTFDFNEHMAITWDKVNTKYEDRYFIPAEYGYKINLKTGEILSKAKHNRKVPAPKAYDIPFGEGEITMAQIEQANER